MTLFFPRKNMILDHSCNCFVPFSCLLVLRNTLIGHVCSISNLRFLVGVVNFAADISFCNARLEG